jgi:hypothetical protein
MTSDATASKNAHASEQRSHTAMRVLKALVLSFKKFRSYTVNCRSVVCTPPRPRAVILMGLELSIHRTVPTQSLRRRGPDRHRDPHGRRRDVSGLTGQRGVEAPT